MRLLDVCTERIQKVAHRSLCLLEGGLIMQMSSIGIWTIRVLVRQKGGGFM